MYQTTTYASPVGELTLASDGTALTGLWLDLLLFLEFVHH